MNFAEVLARHLAEIPDVVSGPSRVGDSGHLAWFANDREFAHLAQRWFEVMRGCGDDVRELLHDGHPTACVADAAFAYVNAFRAHVNVGFFRGAEIADREGLLEGTGRFMRHVKVRPEPAVDVAALRNLIETAYTDMKSRLKAE